jgi:hypothetical protein
MRKPIGYVGPIGPHLNCVSAFSATGERDMTNYKAQREPERKTYWQAREWRKPVSIILNPNMFRKAS